MNHGSQMHLHHWEHFCHANMLLCDRAQMCLHILLVGKSFITSKSSWLLRTPVAAYISEGREGREERSTPTIFMLFQSQEVGTNMSHFAHSSPSMFEGTWLFLQLDEESEFSFEDGFMIKTSNPTCNSDMQSIFLSHLPQGFLATCTQE